MHNSMKFLTRSFLLASMLVGTAAAGNDWQAKVLATLLFACSVPTGA